jgi:hypothetical protein
LSKQNCDCVVANIRLGVRAAQQLTAVRETSNNPFLNQTLYNLNASFKRQRNKGLATTDALVADLRTRGIEVEVRPGLDDRTEHLFIALPESIKLALQNQDVILVDNTYKTNKFNMPLLHMVGKLLYSYFGQFADFFQR